MIVIPIPDSRPRSISVRHIESERTDIAAHEVPEGKALVLHSVNRCRCVVHVVHAIAVKVDKITNYNTSKKTSQSLDIRKDVRIVSW